MRHSYIVVLRETGARNGIHPVSVGQAHGALTIYVAIIESVDGVIDILAGGWIPYMNAEAFRRVEIESVVAGISHRVNAIVKGCLCHGGCVALSVEELHLRLRCVELCSEISTEVDIHLFVALLAVLGGNDYNTIGGTASIDRCRGGVLEDLHAFNVIAVQGVYSRCHWNAIDNIKRIL